MSEAKHLLEVRDLKQYFTVKSGMLDKLQLKAVDGVSFTIDEGETLGLVGESGCGKTTVGRTILHLYKPTAGEVIFDGKPVTDKTIDGFRKDMQIVFQDPYSSLNPRMTVSDIIGEPLDIHKLYANRRERQERIAELLTLVGLNSEHANRYAHEFSGGQRQRIGIARALAVNPHFIVCDEPVSALDVSIQAQVLNLMMDLQEQLGLTYMFITHNLSVVKHISDEIVVLYLGKMVEKAPKKELFANPLHPYTKALMSAIPIPALGYKDKEPELIKGEVTSPIEPKPGCRFAARCPYASEKCVGKEIPMYDMGDGHTVACTLFEKEAKGVVAVD